MSTDPKKFTRTIIFTYIVAGLMVVLGMSMSFHFLPVIVFSGISLLLYLSAIASLHTQYKKYKIGLYRLLQITGVVMAIIVVVLSANAII